jgi:cytochrome P450
MPAPRTTAVHRRPPGPKGLPVVGNMGALTADHVGFLEASMHEYGEIFRLSAGPHDLYMVCNPEHARRVLATNAVNYIKGNIFAKFEGILGDGLFTSGGELWRRQRRLMQPHFHRDVVERLTSAMTGTIAEVIGRWRPLVERAEVVNLMPEMSRLAVDVVGRALFSEDVDRDAATVGRTLTTVLEHLHHRLRAVVDLTDVLPSTWAYRAYHEAVATLRGVVVRIIRERRASGEGRPDLLQLLLDARDPDTGEAMGERQLRDEVMTLFLAGHETTAVALTWTLYLLATNPVVDRQLRGEIARTVGDRTPTAGDLPALAYPRQVFEEVLRLYPPAHGVARDTVADDVIGGYRVPAGSTVVVSTYLLHRNPRLWESPGGFDPERFAPGHPPRHQFSYLPFGGGPRKCIGHAFAVLEGTLAVTMIAQSVRPELAPGIRVRPTPRITLRPNAVHVRLRPAKPDRA